MGIEHDIIKITHWTQSDGISKVNTLGIIQLGICGDGANWRENAPSKENNVLPAGGSHIRNWS